MTDIDVAGTRPPAYLPLTGSRSNVMDMVMENGIARG